MKLTKLLLIVGSILVLTESLHAGFNFSSKNSKIRVGTNARLIVNKNIPNVDGTLDIISHSANSIVGSNTITFDRGRLGNDSMETVFSGIYDPAGNSGEDKIILQGSAATPHRLYSDAGAILQKIEVVGGYNIIEGRPNFEYPIVFDGDPNTTLTVGIESKLNKNIELNDGQIILSDDLALSDDVLIVGDGTINLNEKTFHFPGADSTWTNSLLFDNATDIKLHARTSLTGSWTFKKTSVLNGNGCVLDLTGGGQLVVTPDVTLELNDVVIKGVGDDGGLGGFVFENDNSTIVFSEVTVELESTYTTNQGRIYVDGTSTVYVKDNVWWFDGSSSLTVDGVTLWTDRAGALGTHPLGVGFASPESNFYSSVANGTVKMAANQADFSSLQSLVISNSNAINFLFDLTIANSNAIVGNDVHLVPGEYFEFTSDQTFDGNGINYVFCHWSEPQFRVSAGVTVTLKNIDLLRINENTFSLGAGAKIKIGENVLFELAEDTIWKNGQIELIGDNTIFTIRGMDGIKKWTFQKTCPFLDLVLVLGTNKLLLENIELSGLHLIDGSTKFRDRYFKMCGTLILGGHTIVNVEYNTAMNFLIKENDNEIRMRNNNLSFRGECSFGDSGDNDLHMRFILYDGYESIPRVNFENQFMLVASRRGNSRLIFDDASVAVNNETDRSFVLSRGAFLGGRSVKISENPIKQISADVAFGPDLALTSDDLPNVIEQDFGAPLFRSPLFRSLPLKAPIRASGFRISNNSMKLSEAKNKIVLDSGTITDFGVSKVDGLTLTMLNGSTLIQKDGQVQLKGGDQIIVRGKSNKIVVKDKFIVSGNLSFGDLSELTFKFDKSSEAPEVYFDASYNTLLQIAKGAKIVFSGNGWVTFADGYTIYFEGDSSRAKSQLVLQDSCQALLERNSTVVCTGVGKILIEKNSLFSIGPNRTLIVGQIEDDSIDIALSNYGELAIASKLSLVNGAYSIDLDRGSKILVRNGGLFEINSFDQRECCGILSKFLFRNESTFHIEDGGAFYLGRNRLLSGGAEIPFLWDSSDGFLIGRGLVGASEKNCFVGRLQGNVSGAAYFYSLDLVRFLINKRSDLSVTTFFVDSLGNDRLRTKDGVIVKLLPGDEIVSDDPDSGATSIINSGELVAITSRGERV